MTPCQTEEAEEALPVAEVFVDPEHVYAEVTMLALAVGLSIVCVMDNRVRRCEGRVDSTLFAFVLFLNLSHYGTC